jgi:hypothetical protein
VCGDRNSTRSTLFLFSSFPLLHADRNSGKEEKRNAGAVVEFLFFAVFAVLMGKGEI